MGHAEDGRGSHGFLHHHVALHAVVVRFDKAHLVQHEYFRHGLAGVLLSAPHIRRRIGSRDTLTRKGQVMYLVCRFLDDQALMGELPVTPGASILIHRPPVTREHVKAVVETPVSLPMVRNLEGLHHMGSYRKLREVVAANSVPIAVAVSLSVLSSGIFASIRT